MTLGGYLIWVAFLFEILTLTEMQTRAGKICLLSDHERNTLDQDGTEL